VKVIQRLESKKDGIRLSEICDAVRTLTLVIKYLSNVGFFFNSSPKAIFNFQCWLLEVWFRW